MIELKVEDYCHNCPYFEVTSHTDTLYANGEICIRSTTFTCVNRKRCERLAKHIEREKANP